VNANLFSQLAIGLIGLVALAILVRWLGGAIPRAGVSAFDAALRERTEEEPPLDEFESVRHTLDLARTSAFDVHSRLRPLLRDIARQRLWAGHGIDLDRDPTAAGRFLGAEASGLLLTSAPAPHQYGRRGMELAAIDRIVADLEAI
jgi:hypothetical protein